MPTPTPSAKTIDKVRGALTTEPQRAADLATATKLSVDTVRRCLVAMSALTPPDAEKVGTEWKLSASVVKRRGVTKAAADLQAAAPEIGKVLDAADKASAKKASTPRPAPVLPEDDGAVPGYILRWPTKGFGLYKRTADAPEGSPAWTVRCNEHGETTTTTDDVKAATALGRKADRAVWCKGCKAAAKKAAK
jgi:hypothetical protein